MDYYDYGPRVLLPRPLALVGFVGSGVRQVAHDLAARLGLPLHDIDRMVEHHAGQSLSAVQLERGEVVRRAFEKRAIGQAIRSQPAGILALGDGALMDRKTRNLVRRETTLVFIERPVDEQRARAERGLARNPGLYPELVLGGLPEGDDAALTRLWAQRKAGYSMARERIEAGTLHATRVADLVIERLQLI